MRSVGWLPAVDSFAPGTPAPGREFRTTAPWRANAMVVRDRLDEMSPAAFTVTEQELFRRTLGLLGRHLAADDGGPSPSLAEGELIQRTLNCALRRITAMAVTADGSGIELRARDAEESEALQALVTWARAASGPEALRREGWVEWLSERTFHPGRPLQLPAALIAGGAEPPPGDALRALAPPDELGDRGTLRWRGEALLSGPSVAGLLDRLGVRHLDAPAPALMGPALPEALRDADIAVATLRQTGRLAPADMARRIAGLAAAMPALYLVRLADSQGGIDPAALPPEWIADPAHPGQMFHRRRNANRQCLAPIRDLWPGGRIPPALRAQAVNVPPDGEPVLRYIAGVRHQRAGFHEFSADDVALCAHLGTIVSGLSQDAAFAARCRAMAGQPLGPCADAGMLTLSAMAAQRDAAEAATVADVAGNAFLQACLARADADRVQRHPGFDEVLEEAMVLRWHVSRVLAEVLGADRVRVSDKPLFGACVEGADWDSPARRETFRREALALVAAEVEAGFPGVVQLLSARDDPLGAMFQSRLDQEPDCQAFAASRQAAQDDYARALEDGEEESVALARADGLMTQIDASWRQARLDLLRPALDGIAAQVRAVADRKRAAAGDPEGPPAKRPRRNTQ